jgi:hypothetical protein
LIERFARVSESRWQTTFVVFGSFREDARDLAVGTFPPAHGEIEQSCAGSGQYEARSMCADASTGTSSAHSATTANELNSLNVAVLPIDATSPLLCVADGFPKPNVATAVYQRIGPDELPISAGIAHTTRSRLSNGSA